MPMDKTERLSGIVDALTEYIDVVRAYDMDDTATLLGMAKLDLQMHIHEISDEELQALCEVVEAGQAGQQACAPVPSPINAREQHAQASVVLPKTPVSDRILVDTPRPSKRYKRM